MLGYARSRSRFDSKQGVLASPEQLSEISIEGHKVLARIVNRRCKPCIWEIVAVQTPIDTQLPKLGPLGALIRQMHAVHLQHRIDETNGVFDRRRQLKNSRARYKPQKAGDHHGQQRERSTCPNGAEYVAHPFTCNHVMRVVLA